jgi:hypothetical protein
LREADRPTRASSGPPDAVRPTAAAPDAALALAPNPTLRIDGALGMVVIEFRAGDGRIAASIPTERELAAYRRAAAGGGPPPVAGGPSPATADGACCPPSPSPTRRPADPPSAGRAGASA